MKAHRFTLAALSCLSALLYTSLVMAQVDLSGNWNQVSSQDGMINGPGPFPDDFAGIPINKAALHIGLTFSGDEGQELRRQCEPWSQDYWLIGPWGGRFTAIHNYNGLVIGWHVSSQAYDRLAMDIWTDGRPQPPPLALHSYNGFTTGRWEGDTLHVTATHLKDLYLQRSGLPLSNQATTDLFFTRHGDEMMLMGVIKDPVFLNAPWVLARTLRLSTAGPANNDLLYCMGTETVPGFSDGYHTAVVTPAQEAKQAQYMMQQYHLPRIATDGGVQTMYPEFASRIEKTYRPPSTYCKVYCCMGGRRIKAICSTAE
jgi:hypothetical protein